MGIAKYQIRPNLNQWSFGDCQGKLPWQYLILPVLVDIHVVVCTKPGDVGSDQGAYNNSQSVILSSVLDFLSDFRTTPSFRDDFRTHNTGKVSYPRSYHQDHRFGLNAPMTLTELFVSVRKK